MKIISEKLSISRRDFLQSVFGGGLVLSGLATGEQIQSNFDRNQAARPVLGQVSEQGMDSRGGHGSPGTVGKINHDANGFDPLELLYKYKNQDTVYIKFIKWPYYRPAH